jgi:hypothetical protein
LIAMHITNVSANNVKGHNFSIDLERLVVLVGPSMSGKSAVLDAVVLGLLGYVPGLGLTNKAIFELSSAEAMSVTLTTSEGARTERAWRRNHKGVSASQQVGYGMADLPPVMLDASEYFGRSAEQRLELVFRCMHLNGASLAERIAKVRSLLPAVPALDKLPQIPNENFQTWLARALEAVGEARREAVAAQRRFTATTQALGQQIADAALTADDFRRTLEQLSGIPAEERLRRARDDYQAKTEAYLKLKARHDVRQAQAQRRMTLQTRADRVRAVLAEADEVRSMFLAAEARLKSAPSHDEWSERGAEANAAQERWAMVSAELRTRKLELEELNQREVDVMASSRCPTCLNNQPTWKTRVRNKFKEDRQRLQAMVDKLLAEETEAAASAATARNQHAQAARAYDEAMDARSEHKELADRSSTIEVAGTELEQVEAELANLRDTDDDREELYRTEC